MVQRCDTTALVQLCDAASAMTHTHTHTRNEAAQPCCICSDSCTETPTCTAIHRVQLLTLIAVLHAHLDFKLILNFNKKLFLANNCYIVKAIQISLQQPCAVLGTCVLLCSTGLRLGCVWYSREQLHMMYMINK